MAYTDPWLFDPVGHLQWLGQGGAELGGPGPGGPPPYARKQSIVDRIAARLFPTAAYTGLLDPAAQQGLQRQGLLQLGTSLLQAGGPQAVQAGTLANLGGALQQSQVNFPQMAQQALQLQAYKSQQQEQQAVADIAAKHPITPGMSREDIYNRATDILQEMLTVPGAARLAEQMAPVVAAMRPEKADRARWHFDTIMENGVPVLYRINEDTGVKYPVGMGKQTKTTPQQLQHAEFGAAALAAWKPVEDIRTKNPGVEEEVGEILASPSFAQAVPGFRSSADAVLALQKAGGSAAAQQYMRAKWSFLDNVLRIRYATGRLGGPMLAQMAQEFMPSLDVQGNAQVRQNEIQSILSAQGESGFDENPDVWNKAVRRHGVANLDLQAILGGGGLDTRINQMQVRY